MFKFTQLHLNEFLFLVAERISPAKTPLKEQTTVMEPENIPSSTTSPEHQSSESHQSETWIQKEDSGDGGWEGWDDEDGDDDIDIKAAASQDTPIDSDIDREIEEELVSMGSASKSLVPSSPLPPTVHLDWSDAPTSPKSSTHHTTGSSGGMKLTSIKTRTSPPPQSPTMNTFTESSVKSPNRKHIQTEPTSKDKAKPSSPQKMTKRTSNTPLGSEFDIKALDIKTSGVTSSEPDFFADMAPDIKPSSLLDMIKGAGASENTVSERKAASTMAASTMSYDVQETEVSLC